MRYLKKLSLDDFRSDFSLELLHVLIKVVVSKLIEARQGLKISVLLIQNKMELTKNGRIYFITNEVLEHLNRTKIRRNENF